MSTFLQYMHFVAGLIVLAEALNKLERTSVLAPGLTLNKRLVDALKGIAWTLLGIGGAGALALPVMGPLGVYFSKEHTLLNAAPSNADVAVLVGFATLIIRTRIKEG